MTKVWITQDEYFNRCSWNDDLVEISHCEFVDPDDISVCLECDDGFVWDPIEKMCTACSDLIQDCAVCEATEEWLDGDIAAVKCIECSGDLEIWHLTGTCWESHCEIGDIMSEDACQVCEAGYLLNHKDKLCYESCEEGFIPMTWGQDDEYGECWKDCGSEEESGQIGRASCRERV